MVQMLQIKLFRGFSDLTVEGFERINLIAGANNVGKTALLEALFLLQGAANPELVLRILGFRGLSNLKYEAEALWGHLFYQFDLQKEIEISSRDTRLVERSLKMTLREPQIITARPRSAKAQNSWSAYSNTFAKELALTYCANNETYKSRAYITEDGLQYERPFVSKSHSDGIFLTSRWGTAVIEDTERYSRLEAVGLEGQVLQALQLIEPRLKRLTVVLIGGSPVIHGDIGLGRLIPLPLMGEGMGRLLSLLVAIANVPNGIVLIDEIENGLHHSILHLIWKGIAAFVRQFNVQLFATTHSSECVEAAHDALTESEPYDFRLFRLQRQGQAIQAVSHDQEMLTAALEVGLEVR